MTQLSPHFTLEEMIQSGIAVRRGLDNTPNAEERANLQKLAATLEQVRSLLGHPLIISSGFRSERVNVAVGGSQNSAHCRGLAADFICPAFGVPRDVAVAIRDSIIAFDQLIAEGTWVHLAVDPRMRRQVMTAQFNGGKATYLHGIV